MKRFALIALSFTALVGCGKDTTIEQPTTVAYTIDNRDITCLSFHDAIVSCNWEAWNKGE